MCTQKAAAPSAALRAGSAERTSIRALVSFRLPTHHAKIARAGDPGFGCTPALRLLSGQVLPAVRYASLGCARDRLFGAVLIPRVKARGFHPLDCSPTSLPDMKRPTVGMGRLPCAKANIMAPMTRRQKTERIPSKESRVEGIALTCTQVVIALFVMAFIFQNFAIPSSSMASTLLVGDHVVVERAMLAPPSVTGHLFPYRQVKRGDIIVFYKPVPEADGHHMFLVKRVIGVPGDGNPPARRSRLP